MTPPPKYHLLVVDDEDGPRQSIRMVFRNEYIIHLANSGEQALEIAAEHPIDVAVVDIRMGGISGIEVLKGLKNLDPSTEVLVLTAYETLETARQALRLGARDYIGKPFDVETLRRAVATATMHRKISLRINQVEQELNHLSGELAKTVAREDMTRTINQVYAGVLHDINNPLTIVSCFLDLIMDRVMKSVRLEEPDLVQLRDQLGTISRQIKICSEISSRHLDYLRRPAEATTSVNLVLTDLCELIKVHPIIRSGDIRVEKLSEDVQIHISSAELTQILLNLMINALQNSDDSLGIEVRAEIHHHPLNISQLKQASNKVFLHEEAFENRPPFVGLTIKDQAGGIPPEIVREIFEPYFTTRSRDKGTGLGLSIVSKVVKNARGGIHLDTTFGHGSAFTIYLPIVT
jgi:two-component system, sensor histidine kinase and response regulator